MQGLNLNRVQALVTAELIKELRDDELIPFFAYRANFIEPKMSAELITKNAVFAFRKEKLLKAIKNDKFRFKSVEQLSQFVKAYFKNQNLCYGPDGFLEFAIIGVDENGDLINKYAINEYGKFKYLNGEDIAKVYEWLFNNQERIGVIKFINPEPILKAIEEKEREQKEAQIALENSTKKRNINTKILLTFKRIGV